MGHGTTGHLPRIDAARGTPHGCYSYWDVVDDTNTTVRPVGVALDMCCGDADRAVRCYQMSFAPRRREVEYGDHHLYTVCLEDLGIAIGCCTAATRDSSEAAVACHENGLLRSCEDRVVVVRIVEPDDDDDDTTYWCSFVPSQSE
jgi:hypothetical protein